MRTSTVSTSDFVGLGREWVSTNRPDFFYKYRSLRGEAGEHTRSLIADREVRFSSIKSFNDPFEGRARITLGAPFTPELERKVEEFARESIEGYGLFCVSEKNYDILMWAHYADAHAGVCLEFAGTGAFFKDTFPVEYKDKYPAIRWRTKDRNDHARVIFTSKAEHWAYEKEWRLTTDKPRTLRYPAGTLTGVILGCEISKEDANEVTAWVSEARDDVAIYRAVRQDAAYALDIRAIPEETVRAP